MGAAWRWMLPPLLVTGLLSVSTAHAARRGGPFVEKSVKAAIVMAEEGDDPIPVIVEGESAGSIRDLLGVDAERELGLIKACSARLSAKKIRGLLRSDQVVAIYRDERVELVSPQASAKPTGSDDPKNEAVRELVDQMEDESEAKATYGLRLMRVPQALETVRKVRALIKEKLGQDLPPVRIGIVDTGIDGHHRAFQGMIDGFSDLSADLSPEPRDDHGHGTHVAGTIAGGESPDGIQIGVVPQDLARLAVARGLNPYGMDSWLISSLAYMVDPDRDPSTPDGVQVISNSWGGGRGRPVYKRVIEALTQMGVLCVFAAGNSGPDDGTLASPADYPEVLAVGAVDRKKRAAPFSSRGDVVGNQTSPYIKPDVCAPGVSILSIAPLNQYERWNGTSMAAPHVTGVVALMKAVNPGLKPRDIKLILENTAEDLGEPGKDRVFGSGLVNAEAAVGAAIALMGQGNTLEPSTPEGMFQQAKDLMRQKQLQYAVDNLMKLINDPRFQELTLESRIEAGYLMAEGYRELGQLKAAASAYRGVPMFDKQSPYVPKAEYWLAWCYQQNQGGSRVAHVKEAAKRFEAFLQARGDHEWVPLAAIRLAECYLELRHPQKARQVLMGLLEARPDTEHRITIMQLLERTKGDDKDVLEF